MKLKSEQIEITYMITSDPSFQNEKYGIDNRPLRQLVKILNDILFPF
jgi:hypothetical protein